MKAIKQNKKNNKKQKRKKEKTHFPQLPKDKIREYLAAFSLTCN